MVILEKKDYETGKWEYGFSSAKGDTVADLPTNVPQGSTAIDYTTQTVYFFDGSAWA